MPLVVAKQPKNHIDMPTTHTMEPFPGAWKKSFTLAICKVRLSCSSNAAVPPGCNAPKGLQASDPNTFSSITTQSTAYTMQLHTVKNCSLGSDGLACTAERPTKFEITLWGAIQELSMITWTWQLNVMIKKSDRPSKADKEFIRLVSEVLRMHFDQVVSWTPSSCEHLKSSPRRQPRARCKAL